MTSNTPAVLPQFDQPPVVEVALAVEFLPLPALSAVPMVEMRPLWQDRYPLIEEQPALPSMSADLKSDFGFQIATGIPPVRIWFLSETRTELLQIQSDRLVLNWRKTDPLQEYPRYRRLAPRFDDNWSKFESAVKDRSLGELRPITAEVTYVNRFELNDDETFFDVLTFFAGSGGFDATEAEVRLGRPLVGDENDSEASRFGHQIVTAGRMPGGKGYEVHLTLVTRIEVAGEDLEAIQTALQRGHEIGATSFASVTKPKMHSRWGRTQ